jgi:hypothetical protein
MTIANLTPTTGNGTCRLRGSSCADRARGLPIPPCLRAEPASALPRSKLSRPSNRAAIPNRSARIRPWS